MRRALISPFLAYVRTPRIRIIPEYGIDE